MITREELLKVLQVPLTIQVEYDLMNPIEQGILTVEKVEDNSLFLVKENGAKIIMPLGASYKYNYDGKIFEIIHNDRVTGWTVVTRMKICPL